MTVYSFWTMVSLFCVRTISFAPYRMEQTGHITRILTFICASLVVECFLVAIMSNLFVAPQGRGELYVSYPARRLPNEWGRLLSIPSSRIFAYCSSTVLENRACASSLWPLAITECRVLSGMRSLSLRVMFLSGTNVPIDASIFRLVVLLSHYRCAWHLVFSTQASVSHQRVCI